MLDATGNLKAVQKLLGHASIQTTGDIYTDWDVEQLAESLMQAVEDDACANHSHHVPGKPCSRAESGGGGNRTRVRGRTGQSVYERSSRFISLGGRFANDPPPSQPS